MVSALASLKVCIVDADGDMRQMIRDALTSLGISQIRECADSGMAQQLIHEFEPDLCIFDWSTGPVDAITFIKNVRADILDEGDGVDRPRRPVENTEIRLELMDKLLRHTGIGAFPNLADTQTR